MGADLQIQLAISTVDWFWTNGFQISVCLTSCIEKNGLGFVPDLASFQPRKVMMRRRRSDDVEEEDHDDCDSPKPLFDRGLL